MKHSRYIPALAAQNQALQSKVAQTKIPDYAGQLAPLPEMHSPALSHDFIQRFVAGILVMLGLRLEDQSAQAAHLRQVSTYTADMHRQMDNRDSLKAMINDWAGGPAISAKRQGRNLWLASKAINNSPDPNIRRSGHDAWATKRAYPRVPGICVANIRDLPAALCQVAGGSRLALRLAGNTAAEFSGKIVIAPP